MSRQAEGLEEVVVAAAAAGGGGSEMGTVRGSVGEEEERQDDAMKEWNEFDLGRMRKKVPEFEVTAFVDGC